MLNYLDLGGTIRAQTAKLTLEHLQSVLKKIGITRVANITGLDSLGLPVAVSIRPNSKHLAVSQGKGLSWELAAVSAIMESLESYHLENSPDYTLYGSYRDLISHYPMINPLEFLPSLFSPIGLQEYPMGWVQAQSLSHPDEIFFIPHVLTCLDTTVRHPEYAFFSVTTNGLAAGNTQAEAMCHALYEIIERDALCRWGDLPEEAIAKTQLKLESIDSEMNSHIIEKFQQAQQLIKIWDITSCLGIPAFHCVIKDAHPLRGLGLFRGTGAHLSKTVALSRALTEAAQSRLTVISGARDDIFTDQYLNRTSFDYSREEYAGVKHYQDCVQPLLENSFEKNIHFICQRLILHEFKKILYIDHTRADLNIPVIQIFIPGMSYNGTRI